MIIAVVDLSGNTVIKGKANKQSIGKYENQFDLSSLSEGTYFLSIKIYSEIINHKFVILK